MIDEFKTISDTIGEGYYTRKGVSFSPLLTMLQLLTR